MLNPISELIIFFGDCGSGKSSLIALFADIYVKEQGTQRWELSEQIIRELNVNRKQPLSFPSAPPIYSTSKYKLKDKYGHNVKIIGIKSNEIGISNKKEKYKALYPASLLIIDEAYSEFCSKGELTKGQRNFFLEYRHNRLIILIASPRAILINKDIRNAGARFIEVCGQTHEYDPFGRICKTTWHCRESTSKDEVEEYIKTDGQSGTFTETTYEYNGNIFDLYNSFAYVTDFMPQEGEDFET